MAKRIFGLVMVLAVLALASVASAEWGDIGGIKPKSTVQDLRPIHVEEELPIWKQ